ncbi:MAG: type II toxin-antitoxin system HipA family toxin [Ignavibacteriales bacterium]|jgi:serine/threonine-protein kinase HipA|nr:MAG: type II toxin-antitoxin system HipA family toxin [Ignavibacteriales bacterium]
MKKDRKEILVYADWQSIKGARLMGVLYSEVIRGKEIFSFQYSDEWLNADFAQVLDPDLRLYQGKQYLNEGKDNFGIFLDSSPDRWGRLLMRRREAVLARIEKRIQNILYESDYLLGVFDEHRSGAIRFKTNADGAFLNDNKDLATPPFTTIKKLEQASLRIEQDELINDPEYIKWLNLLIAPGSSLGGARPKASVIDEKGNLWIAKFPSINDEKNIGAWEMVVHELALKAGIDVADAMIKKYSSRYHTFLTKRFDRIKSKRIHFASAMTLLGYSDGSDFSQGVSYLELAEFIAANGAKVNEDLEELWKRIVFNICVSNTDDHLRNHGFILTDKGWILSPAYDVNPNERGTGLNLNISENDNSLELDLAMEVIEYFRLSEKRALKIISRIRKAVEDWREVARKYKIPKTEQDVMQSAFFAH